MVKVQELNCTVYEMASSNREIVIVSRNSSKLICDKYLARDNDIIHTGHVVVSNQISDAIFNGRFIDSSISPNGRLFVVYSADQDETHRRLFVYDTDSCKLVNAFSLTNNKSVFRHVWENDNTQVVEFYRSSTGEFEVERRDVITGVAQTLRFINTFQYDGVPIGLVDDEAVILLTGDGNAPKYDNALIKAPLSSQSSNIVSTLTIKGKHPVCSYIGWWDNKPLLVVDRLSSVPRLRINIRARSIAIEPRAYFTMATCDLNVGKVQLITLSGLMHFQDVSRVCFARIIGPNAYVLTTDSLYFGIIDKNR